MRSNKLMQILKDESGASMIFTLCIMLLLMAIGVSALAASSANAGAGINQQTYNQLTMYAESAQKSIMYSLQISKDPTYGDVGKRVDDDTSNISPLDTLGGQLIRALYINENNDLLPSVLDVDLEVKLDGDAVPIEVSIDFIDYAVDIIQFEAYDAGFPDIPATPDIDEYVPPTYAQPKSASIKAEVVFTIIARQNGKAVTYTMTYQLSGVELMMGSYNAFMTTENPVMEIADAGIWRVKAYDKIEN